MAKWALDKKKAKEAQEKASLQKEQEKEALLKTCKYGVLLEGKFWLVELVRKDVIGSECKYSRLQKEAHQFTTQDKADECACGISLGTADYLNGKVKAAPLVPWMPGS